MVLKEVRKNIKNKKGKTTNKLVFKALVREDSFVISVKQPGFNEPVLVDIAPIIEPYVDEGTMHRIKSTCHLIHEKKKKEQ